MAETNRDKALRGGIVVVTDARLKEMQEQAVRHEGVTAEPVYHWHWAAVLNELVARRTGALPAVETPEPPGAAMAAMQETDSLRTALDHLSKARLRLIEWLATSEKAFDQPSTEEQK